MISTLYNIRQIEKKKYLLDICYNATHSFRSPLNTCLLIMIEQPLYVRCLRP